MTDHYYGENWARFVGYNGIAAASVLPRNDFWDRAGQDIE